MPSDISLSGLSKYGSQQARMAASQLVDAGAGRHPTGLDVQLGHTFVVTLEERAEILRQVFLIAFGQGTDYAEIQRDVAPESGCVRG